MQAAVEPRNADADCLPCGGADGVCVLDRKWFLRSSTLGLRDPGVKACHYDGWYLARPCSQTVVYGHVELWEGTGQRPHV